MRSLQNINYFDKKFFKWRGDKNNKDIWFFFAYIHMDCGKGWKLKLWSLVKPSLVSEVKYKYANIKDFNNEVHERNLNKAS